MKKTIIMALILMLTPFIVASEASATDVNSYSNNKTLTPDLKITNVAVHGSVVRGCNISVKNTVTNIGNGSAGGFWVKYYLKTTSSSGSYLLGKRYINGLKSGSSNTQNTLLYIPTNMPRGSYLVMASTDTTNSVVESNKKNNIGYSSRITVVGPTYIIFDKNVGGDVLKNPDINRYIPKTSFATTIFNLEKSGSVMLKFGNGNGPKVLISAGIHGNETEANIAIMKYLEYIKDKSFNGTLYVIPFDIPLDTAKNTRFYHGQDPNRIANVAGSPGWNIIHFAHVNGINYLLDVHSGGEVTSKGLLNINTGTSNSQEVKWAHYITSVSGCVSRVQPLETGMVRAEAFKYKINTITMEVERDTASTIVYAAKEFRMIKSSMKFFQFPVPLN
ncbi:MAG: hypothetical protein F8N15_06940 [Methanobacterium sp.]|nr:hypothetical protein [Methanobacterium sp.]